MSETMVSIIVDVMCVLVLVAAIVGAVRLRIHRRRKKLLGNRHGDLVHYTFVINPSKPTAAQVRAHIEQFCMDSHIQSFDFIETQLDKDGRTCALEALDNGTDVVIAVGGDGTVRTVASAMAGSEHAMGIIPIGTGNLFARNMGIPVDDLDAALGIAVSHGSQKVDVGRLTLLDQPDTDHGHAFLIIAGIGFDAVMIDDTDPELKKNISWLAYFVSGAKHLFAPKYHASVSITNEAGETRTNTDLQFRTFLAGNCGQIPMFSLMPDAQFSDGLLDFEVIDTTGGIIGWANLFGDVVHQTITGKAQQSPLSWNSKIDQLQGVSAEIRLPKAVPAQVDGDILPPTAHLKFTVEHNALFVRVPTVDVSAL